MCEAETSAAYGDLLHNPDRLSKRLDNLSYHNFIIITTYPLRCAVQGPGTDKLVKDCLDNVFV